jgi:hypothetical protein
VVGGAVAGMVAGVGGAGRAVGGGDLRHGVAGSTGRLGPAWRRL